MSALDDVLNAFGTIRTEFNKAKIFVNNITTGLYQLLDTVQSTIDSQILANNLPLVGQKLQNSTEQAVKFIDTINQQIIASLGQLDELGDLPPQQLQNRLFAAIDDLGVLNQPIAKPFSEAFQNQLSAGASVQDALTTAVNTILPNLNGLLSGSLSSNLLVNTILANVGEADLVSLNASELRQAVFEAIGELNLLNFENFLPASEITRLIDTFQTQLTSGRNVPDALQTALQDVVSTLNPSLFQSGIVPTTESLLGAVLPELTDELTGQLDGLFDEILSGPLTGIATALSQALNVSVADIVAKDIPQEILLQLFNEPGDLEPVLQTALQSALVKLNLLQSGQSIEDAVFQSILNQLQTELVDPLTSFLDGLNVLQKPLQTVEQALESALGQDVTILPSSNEINFSTKLTGNKLLDNAVPIEADIGFPGLGFAVDGNVDLGVNFAYDLRFGYDLANNEIFIDTASNNELNLGLTGSAQFESRGKLGFLQLDIADLDQAPTTIDLGFDVDLLDGPDADQRLTLSQSSQLDELSQLDLNVIANGDAQVNLQLDTSFNGSEVLPSIGSDFNLLWEFTNSLTDPTQPNEFGNIPQVSFNNVTLNLGTFFDNFVSPVFKNIQAITDHFPIQQLVNVLQTRLPVLDNLGRSFLDRTGSPGGGPDGKVTLLDLVAIYDPDANLDFIGATSSFIGLINRVPTDIGDLSIDLGSFNLGAADVRTPEFQISDPNQAIPSNIMPVDDIVQQLDDLLQGVNALAGGTATREQIEAAKNFFDDPNNSNDVTDTAGLQFPLLDQPINAFKLLLNQPVDLFLYDVPQLDFDLTYSQFFPIIGPLGAEIEGRLLAGIDLDLGFDTTGLVQFNSTGSVDDILNGFFISTPPADNKSPTGFAPAAFLEASLKAFGAINAGVASAGVGGGILSTLNAFLADDHSDGRVHLDEVDLPCFFDPIAGTLTAGLSAFVKVGFGPFSYTKRFNIAKATLLSFEIGCSGDDPALNRDLAKNIDNGVLELSMGPRANQRLIGGEVGTDIAEFFTVQRPENAGNNSVQVSAFGINRSFENITSIKSDGGQEDDTIVIADSISLPTDLKGGSGNDQLYGGSGADNVAGDNGDDALLGGSGDDTLSGGEGEDFLEGGPGADRLDGGAEPNDGVDQVSYRNSDMAVRFTPDGTGGFVGMGGDAEGDRLIEIEYIEGSDLTDAGDVLLGDEDKNTLEGLRGNDTIVGGGGDDFVIGGAGADQLDGGAGRDSTSYQPSKSGVVINLATGLASGGDAQGDTLSAIEDVQGSSFADRLIGNSSSNRLDGVQGNDEIQGGDGEDELFGGAGDDTVIGGAAADTLDGGGLQNVDPGKDWLSYRNALNGVTVSLKTGRGTDGEADGDVLAFAQRRILSTQPNGQPTFATTEYSTFENLEGSNWSDRLEGDVGQNIIKGWNGDDTLSGDDGNDTLIGGAGADAHDGGAGLDWVDYRDASAGVTINLLGIGNGSDATGDTFAIEQTNQSTVENITGSDFADNLTGDSGNNEFDPRLSNGSIDTVVGAEGNDRLILDYSRNDIGSGLVGGYAAGSDQSGVFSRNLGDNTLDAVNFDGIENLTITATIQNDRILAGAGDDVIFTGAGDDTIWGGRGQDVILAEDGNDNVIDQENSDRELSGFLDNSFIVLDGGNGIDTLSADLSAKPDDIFLESLNPQVENPNQKLVLADGSLIQRFEVFQNIRTGSGNDRLIQFDRIDNNFSTESGNDVVNPGLGFDTVNGGSDLIITGALARTGQSTIGESIIGESIYETDVLILDYSIGDIGSGMQAEIATDTENGGFNASLGGRYYRTSATGALLDEVNFSQFEQFEITGTSQIDQLIGGDGADRFQGNAGDDNLAGNAGNDVILAGAGNDRAIGGLGNDTVSGDDGNDVLIDGDDLFDPEFFLYRNGGDDRYEGGSGNDILNGGKANDQLLGQSGDDRLFGEDGNDDLNGGAGNDILIATNIFFLSDDDLDTLTGGEGSDEFWLGNSVDSFYLDESGAEIGDSLDSYAHVVDFNPNQGDILQLHGSAEEYYLVNTATGVDIFRFYSNDRIATIDNVTGLDFDQPYVRFVDGEEQTSFASLVADAQTTDPHSVDSHDLHNSQPGVLNQPTANRGNHNGSEPLTDLIHSTINPSDTAVSQDMIESQENSTSTFNLTNTGDAIENTTESFAIDRNNIPAQLLTNLLGDTTGLSNITAKLEGDARASGTFSGDPFGLGTGVVLSTGKVEDLVGENTIDGGFSNGLSLPISFTKLPGLTGGFPAGTAVYVADLSDLRVDINSFTIRDGGVVAGSPGRFTGFDLDAIKFSNTLVSSAAEVEALPSFPGFDFSPAGTTFTPGNQLSPIDPGNPTLFGTTNGFVNNGIATLTSFDGNSTTGSGADGFVSLGLNGQLSFDLTQPIPSNAPLYVYIGEVGDNGEIAGGEISLSDRPTTGLSDLSTDFAPQGTAKDTTTLTIEFDADTSVDQLFLQFVFGSEEFVERGGKLNDTFNLKLNNLDMAVLSDGSAATITNLVASAAGPYHPDYINNPVGTGPASDQTKLDGYTKPLTFAGRLEPGRNTLEITVADQETGLFDSAIFLKSGSLGTIEPSSGGGGKPPITITPEDGVLVGGSGDTTRLQFDLQQADTQFVNELGIFIVDEQGRVQGIAPGEAGYREAAIAQGQIIFSALAGDQFPELSRSTQLSFKPGDQLAFYLVQNDSTDNVQADLADGRLSSTVFFGATNANIDGLDHLQIQDLGHGSFNLLWEDTTGNGDRDFNDMVVRLSTTSETAPVGSTLQNKPQQEIIDLTGLAGQQVQASFTVDSDSAFDNIGGLYRLADNNGTVIDPVTGQSIAPGERGYNRAVFRQTVVEFGENGTEPVILDGGALYAPYLVTGNACETIYIPYLAGNSDGFDHLRLTGNNSFAFEDLLQGGDLSYNDFNFAVDLTIV